MATLPCCLFALPFPFFSPALNSQSQLRREVEAEARQHVTEAYTHPLGPGDPSHAALPPLTRPLPSLCPPSTLNSCSQLRREVEAEARQHVTEAYTRPSAPGGPGHAALPPLGPTAGSRGSSGGAAAAAAAAGAGDYAALLGQGEAGEKLAVALDLLQQQGRELEALRGRNRALTQDLLRTGTGPGPAGGTDGGGAGAGAGGVAVAAGLGVGGGASAADVEARVAAEMRAARAEMEASTLKQQVRILVWRRVGRGEKRGGREGKRGEGKGR